MFDLDDVLVEFVAPFFEWHNRRYGTDLTVEDLAETRYLFTRLGSLNRTGDGSPVEPPARRPVSSIGSYQLPTNGNWQSHLVLSGLLEATRRVVDSGPGRLSARSLGACDLRPDREHQQKQPIDGQDDGDSRPGPG